MKKLELIARYRALATQLMNLAMSSGKECGCVSPEEFDIYEGPVLCKLHNDDGPECKCCTLIHELADLEEVRIDE